MAAAGGRRGTGEAGRVELEEARVVLEREPGEEHHKPVGVVHGCYAAEVRYVRPVARDAGRVLR